ncbi:MAG: hypothetical protein NUV45_02120 [Tepidanaerobacteraceae bacterium]|jgi:CRISPR-associated protein Cmr2|nr:hypothetical protein [Tepidanaerobacteraceae bacterium]
MKDLREEFGKIKLSEYIDKESTFSAGVAIARLKTPISEVLKWARKMEKEAKEINDWGKDAFGIAVLKRSGESIEPEYLTNDLCLPGQRTTQKLLPR